MILGQPLTVVKNDNNYSDTIPKACFDDIYVQDDPREYYRVLYGLDYIIPDLARGVFRSMVATLEEQHGRPIKVLDLGCSYGNNAILLRTPLDLARLAQRYGDLAAQGLSTEECAELDQRYFQSWPRHPMSIVGLDSSKSAIAYAKRTGVIDDGIAADLETNKLSDRERELLHDVDLIISTGCIGYVTERTFSQILDAIDGPAPWVASFVLRMYEFAEIEKVLGRRGLVTQKLEGATFVQRRFHSEQECREVLNCLEQAGISTQSKEADGLLHAELYVSRPQADVDAVPLDQVASITTGEHHTFGRRYRRAADDTLLLGK